VHNIYNLFVFCPFKNNLISDRSKSIKLFIRENIFKILLAKLNLNSLISGMALFHSAGIPLLKFKIYIESVTTKLKKNKKNIQLRTISEFI